jgi:3-oxoacyl-[acyl-carrier protein] reductase
MSKLSGKVAIVTGASKGIGAAVAKSLAASGASVVVNYASSKEGANKVVEAIKAAGGKAIAVKGDVSKAADARAVVDAAIKTFGRLDVLVNNAGVYEMKPLEEITEEHYHKIFDINVLGLLLISKEAAKHLGKGGSIVNIGSGVSRITPPNSAVYTATKGAVDAITGVLSRELGPKGIRVNSVNPGMVETGGLPQRRLHRLELPGLGDLRDTARTHRPASRHRRGRDLPGDGRRRVVDWAAVARQRRHAVNLADASAGAAIDKTPGHHENQAKPSSGRRAPPAARMASPP